MNQIIIITRILDSSCSGNNSTKIFQGFYYDRQFQTHYSTFAMNHGITPYFAALVSENSNSFWLIEFFEFFHSAIRYINVFDRDDQYNFNALSLQKNLLFSIEKMKRNVFPTVLEFRRTQFQFSYE